MSALVVKNMPLSTLFVPALAGSEVTTSKCVDCKTGVVYTGDAYLLSVEIVCPVFANNLEAENTRGVPTVDSEAATVPTAAEGS